MHCFVLKNLGSAKHAPISLHFRTNKVAPKHEQFLLLFIHVSVQLWFDTISIKSDIYTLRHDVFVLLDISRTTCPLINFTSNISQIFLSIFLSLFFRKKKSQPTCYEPNFLFVYAYTLCQGHKMRFRRFYCYKMHTPQSLFSFFVRKKLYILIQVHFL